MVLEGPDRCTKKEKLSMLTFERRLKFFSIRNLLWVSFIVCTVCLGYKESERGGMGTIIVEKLSLVQNVSNFLNK